jgi:PAS domain S-box-containing protein
MVVVNRAFALCIVWITAVLGLWRKRIEATLREGDVRLRAVVATAVDGIITIDERGTVESFNAAAERLFGYPAAEVIGHNVGRLMPAPYREEHDGYLARYLHTGEKKIIGIGREVVGQRKDGTIFPLALAVSEMRLGPRRMFTGIVHDITPLRLHCVPRLAGAVGEYQGICGGIAHRLRGDTARPASRSATPGGAPARRPHDDPRTRRARSLDLH